MALTDKLERYAVDTRSRMDVLIEQMSDEDYDALVRALSQPHPNVAGIARAVRAEYPTSGVTESILRKWKDRNIEGEVNGL